MYVGSGKRLRELDQHKHKRHKSKSTRAGARVKDAPAYRGTCDVVRASDKGQRRQKGGGGTRRRKRGTRRRYSPMSHPLGWIAGLIFGIGH